MKHIILIFLIALSFQAQAQHAVLNANSHKDSQQRVPFWTAYNAHFGSVETGVFAVDGELYATNRKSGIKKGQTINALYLEPLILRFRQNRNTTWPDCDGKLQLLLDVKTQPEATLDLIAAKLSQHPEVFDRSVNPNAVQVVICGNVPVPADFGNYPPFIMFEGRLTQTYSPEQLERIALYSATWDVRKTASAEERDKVAEAVKTAHGLNKKIRFRSTEDTPEVWNLFLESGVDYINTSQINELTRFLNQ